MRCSRCGGRDPGCYVCREDDAPDRADHDYESACDAALIEEDEDAADPELEIAGT